MENILRERRLRWLGHVLRMDHRRMPQQALYREVPGFKRGPGRPRANWIGTVKKDLRKMTLTWEEADVAALDRQEWRRSAWLNVSTWMRYGLNQGQGQGPDRMT